MLSSPVHGHQADLIAYLVDETSVLYVIDLRSRTQAIAGIHERRGRNRAARSDASPCTAVA